MRVVLVAADVGPSNSLALVAGKLIEEGHEVVTFFGKGQPFAEGTGTLMLTEIAKAQRVLIGLSSTAARSEIENWAARVAWDSNVPYGFFAATYGEFRRAWFKEALLNADFLFVLNDGEVEGAKEFAPNAKIVASGNPDWATYFTPISTRDSVRERLGIKAGEKLILVAGSKEVVRNTLLWSNAVLAANWFSQMSSLPLHLILARHPGEKNVKDEDNTKHLYGDILRLSKHPVQFLSGMSSNEALIGCDLVVSSISTVGITAACQSIPVIDFITPFDEAWWKELSGSTLWPPAKQGASRQLGLATTSWEFAQTMQGLMASDSVWATNMRGNQKKAFSLEAVKSAAATIAATLVG